MSQLNPYPKSKSNVSKFSNYLINLRTNSNSFFVIGIWAVDNLTEIIVKYIVKRNFIVFGFLLAYNVLQL